MTDGLNLRLRLLREGRPAMGPGKALLLEAIRDTGSIAAAGRRLAMSYRKARGLVAEMNADFQAPLVDAAKGGNLHGGARLTPLGAEVLARFRTLESAALAGARDALPALEALLSAPASVRLG